MRRLEAITWVLTLCSDLRLSQAKTLADLAAAAMHVGRVSLANIGRKLLGPTAAKHRIKRTWRFCANGRVHVSDAMHGLIRRLCKRRKKKPLVIALDWTDLRSFQTLMAAAVMKGRALPLLWETHPRWKFHKSQNAIEEGLLVLLRTLVPESVPVVIGADRGFGRTELARTCQQLRVHYLVRIKPDVWVEHRRFTGLLSDYPVRKGLRHVLRGAVYRKDGAVTHNVVIHWKPGLPEERDRPWYLMTDLGAGALKLTLLYGRRMTVEELFRDDKNRRNGMALRNTQLTKADRIDRLLLVLALAYWLLVGIGLLARQRFRPGAWCSSNDEGQCSAFTIGKVMIDDMQVSAAAAFRIILEATIEATAELGTT
jgi:Transposase DDE domain